MIKNIRLNTIDSVKKFVNETLKCQFDVYLVSGRYIINAKSIMGILSLDLDKSIELHIDSIDLENAKDYLNSISEYMVD